MNIMERFLEVGRYVLVRFGGCSDSNLDKVSRGTARLQPCDTMAGDTRYQHHKEQEQHTGGGLQA